MFQRFSIPSKIATAAMLLLGACVIWAPGAIAGENYALIVSASDYPNLDKKFWLAGPKNDARLVRDFLVNNASVPFRSENVTTLGSGEGLELATHRAILANLSALAAKTKAGDFVFLQFSGHGSQQPARVDANEPDGRDEIFLSADATLAPEGSPYLPNVLTDDELSVALTAIRSTGAFVWLVFDSCYSGTMTRGAPDDGGVVTRDIDPGELGIPASAFPAALTMSDGERAIPLSAAVFEDENSNRLGGLVAFFAAQSTETTPEKPYEVTREDGTVIKENYGVFTYTVFSELAKNPSLTYRQLAQSVLANYAAGNVLKPTPLFEGALDAPVFGSQDAQDVAQWPTVVGSDKSLSIAAGQLHGLSTGTKLLVLPSPAASNEDALGILEVGIAEQLRSKLFPTTDMNVKQIDVETVPVGAYVRLAEQTYPFELVVAKPDPTSAGAERIAQVEDALREIVANDEKPMRIRVVEAGEKADVRLAVFTEKQVFDLEVQADRTSSSANPLSDEVAASELNSSTPSLWLLPASGEISLRSRSRTPSMNLGPDDTTNFVRSLSENLVTIFRATSLSRLTQASTFKPKDFELVFGVQRAGTNSVTDLRSEATPVIRPGDRLFVNFRNNSSKSVDLNLLYVDADYGITLLCRAHLAKNDKLFQPIADLNDSDRGAERIIAVVNESGKDLTDLSFLEQRGVVVRTRGPADVGVIGMIADLASGQPTRGPTPMANQDTKQPRGAVVMVPLEVGAATDADLASTLPVDAEPFTSSCDA